MAKAIAGKDGSATFTHDEGILHDGAYNYTLSVGAATKWAATVDFHCNQEQIDEITKLTGVEGVIELKVNKDVGVTGEAKLMKINVACAVDAIVDIKVEFEGLTELANI